MAVQTALSNIPLLGAVPNIFEMYSNNTGFSFIVDLILLCTLFSLLLAPLGTRVLKHGGQKFGAVLGLVFGAGAAFALRDLGVQLFRYWFLTAAIMAVIGVMLYKMLTALGGSKLFAFIVSMLIALTGISFWLVGTGRTPVWAGWIGIILLLALPFPLIFWMGSRAGGGHAIGQIATAGAKGLWNGLKSGVGRIFSRKSEDQKRLEHEEGRGGLSEEDIKRLEHEENRGLTNVTAASATEDATTKETEKAANDVVDSAKVVKNAGDEGAKIADKFNLDLKKLITTIGILLTRTKITKQDIDLLNIDIIAVQKEYAVFNSPLNKLRAGLGKIQGFETKINASIAAHYNLKRAVDSWNLSQLKARIDSLKNNEGKTALMPRYNDLNRKITNLKAIVASVDLTIQRMQTQHLPFLTQVKNSTEYATLNSYFKSITDSLKQAINYISPVIAAYTRNPDAPLQNRTKETLMNIKPLFEQIVTVDVIKLKASWERIATTQSTAYEDIKKDISTWTRAYSKVKKEGITVITSSITTINSLVEEEEKKERAEAEKQKADKGGAAAPESPQQGAVLRAIIAEISAVKENLTTMIASTKQVVNAITRTEKFTKDEKELKTAAKDAIDAAVADAKFSAIAENDVMALLQGIGSARQQVDARIKALTSANVKKNNPELVQLKKLQSNLIAFLGAANSISDLLIDTKDTLVAMVTAAVSQSKAGKTSAQVKASILKKIEKMEADLEFLKVETSALQKKSKPSAPPSDLIDLFDASRL